MNTTSRSTIWSFGNCTTGGGGILSKRKESITASFGSSTELNDTKATSDAYFFVKLPKS